MGTASTLLAQWASPLWAEVVVSDLGSVTKVPGMVHAGQILLSISQPTGKPSFKVSSLAPGLLPPEPKLTAQVIKLIITPGFVNTTRSA